MGDVKGSKDGCNWEEVLRKEHGSEYNRFSDWQYIKNLTLLQKWCEKKIMELTKKIDEEGGKPKEGNKR